MATVTEYLERSMQNCSMSVGDDELGMTDQHIPISDTFFELNSHISIASHLEKCLDLNVKGTFTKPDTSSSSSSSSSFLDREIYYRNWNNGIKVKEDPRKPNNADQFSGESYGSVFSEGDSSYCETEESSTESYPSSRENRKKEEEEEDVLVVAGCKACFMYFMVPKLLEGCPKCASQLLYFDQPHSASP